MQLHNKINKEELKQRMLESDEQRITLSFYRYAHIANPVVFRDYLYATWNKIGVFGRTYIAKEGVNAQISIPEQNFEAFKKSLNDIDFLQNLRLNIAIEDDGKSFYKLTIKLKHKIVADGLNDDSFDVTDGGTHVDAQAFNQLTDDPNTIIIDMRNHYESEVGHFENAICPDVVTFRESLPIITDDFADQKDKNVVMYCTGGIRCEKASAYFKHKGFKNVFQLDGGIIEYTRQVNNKGLKNKFKGKNFVFDERMGERISEDIISNCHQCGTPCDTHVNCANDACHILFLQCPACAKKYNETCSSKCQSFITLPIEQQIEQRKTTTFNGSKFSKARYNKNKGNSSLDLS